MRPFIVKDAGEDVEIVKKNPTVVSYIISLMMLCLAIYWGWSLGSSDSIAQTGQLLISALMVLGALYISGIRKKFVLSSSRGLLTVENAFFIYKKTKEIPLQNFECLLIYDYIHDGNSAGMSNYSRILCLAKKKGVAPSRFTAEFNKYRTFELIRVTKKSIFGDTKNQLEEFAENLSMNLELPIVNISRQANSNQNAT